MTRLNTLGQPIGEELPGWVPPGPPSQAPLEGRWCRLVRPLAAHAAPLHAANALDVEGRMWTYLGYGPFADPAAYGAWLDSMRDGVDPLFFAIVDRASGEPVGLAAYLRIDPRMGTIEVGHIALSPRAQRTRVATEAMYLMMARAFQAGYRRYEWKCDDLNAPSRAAALRLGFRYEGTFRQAVVYKGRNRDTAWYAILDRDWPALEAAYQRWLAPGNFDADGRQREPLNARAADR